mgnify:CR=1 FL=1
MSTLFPYDLLFRDFFKSDLDFQPATTAKFTHPVDIFETDKGLHFEVACTGLSKEDIDLYVDNEERFLENVKEFNFKVLDKNSNIPYNLEIDYSNKLSKILNNTFYYENEKIFNSYLLKKEIANTFGYEFKSLLLEE